MTLGLFPASLLIMIGAAAAGCGVFSRLWCPATARWLGRLVPAHRANLLLAWAASPLMSGVLILGFILAPSVAHLLGLAGDHCHSHAHHAHLCLVHTPWLTGSPLERLLLGAAGATLLGWAFAVGLHLRPAQRARRMLLALGRPARPDLDCQVVASARPFALTAGLLRPRVLVSSGLLAELSPAEVATVLAHERAHQRRRDGLRLLAAEILSRLHLPATRRVILEQLRLAAEQACDEVAARRSGDRLEVAVVIVKLTRLAGAWPHPTAAVGPAFIGADTTVRVQALLGPPLPPRPWLGPGVTALIGLLIGAGLITSDWWHHSAESLFGFYLG